MSHLNEKVSYLRGLMEGMKLDVSTNEGMLLSKIVDVLDSIACDIADLADAQEELNEYVDSIDQDLADLEEVFEDEADFDDEDDDDYEDEDDFDFGDEVIYEVKCPVCNAVINLDEDMLEAGSIECPDCGEELEFDADDVEEE